MHLLLDGAGYNQPDTDDGDDKPGSNAPPKPDEKTDPVGALRWDLTVNPMIPGFMRMPESRVEEECATFAQEIKDGKYHWDDADSKWVRTDA